MKQNTPEVILSLTTIPGAVGLAIKTLRSIFVGSVLPDKIVLYLTASQFPDGIPEELEKLKQECGLLEIRMCDLPIRSYTKLVPALKEFPDDIVVTIDDDVNYHKKMLADLLRLHKQYPDYVIANRAKRIAPEKPYKKWHKYHWYDYLRRRLRVGYGNLLTGVGGVLYPPHVLKEEMIDPQLFMESAPTADDIWFWAAAVANDRKIVQVPYGVNRPKGFGKPRELTLKWGNFKAGVDRNKQVFEAILKTYPEIRQKLEDERKG